MQRQLSCMLKKSLGMPAGTLPQVGRHGLPQPLGRRWFPGRRPAAAAPGGPKVHAKAHRPQDVLRSAARSVCAWPTLAGLQRRLAAASCRQASACLAMQVEHMRALRGVTLACSIVYDTTDPCRGAHMTWERHPDAVGTAGVCSPPRYINLLVGCTRSAQRATMHGGRWR